MTTIVRDIYFKCISARSKKRKIFLYASYLKKTRLCCFLSHLGLKKVAKKHKDFFWKHLFIKLRIFHQYISK